MSHPEELFELVSDTIADPLASGHIEHSTDPIDAVAEVSHVRTHVLPKGRSDIQIKLVDHGSSEVVCHVDIIGTGFGDLGSMVDALLTGTISLCFQSLKWGHVINNCLSTSELRCNNLALRFQLFVFSLLGNQCVIH